MSLAFTREGESVAEGVVMLRSRYMTPFPPCTSFVWDNVPKKVTSGPGAQSDLLQSLLMPPSATSYGLRCQRYSRGPH